ncbi:hypothetical protein BQ8794_210037 [Mesorhizobium prunaredense]|uniref:Uncharacterized protein n=1 Tax=Mesorhizobium prunaredense TaxID=1631249 RepID=A0A1R3V5Z3_9HYPH|nr:hypothetical protein BQ8794_210037 [Mesorhizobium prunaredense]
MNRSDIKNEKPGVSDRAGLCNSSKAMRRKDLAVPVLFFFLDGCLVIPAASEIRTVAQ